MDFYFYVTGAVFTFLFSMLVVRLLEGPIDSGDGVFLYGIIAWVAAVLWPVGLPCAIGLLICSYKRR